MDGIVNSRSGSLLSSYHHSPERSHERPLEVRLLSAEVAAQQRVNDSLRDEIRGLEEAKARNNFHSQQAQGNSQETLEALRAAQEHVARADAEVAELRRQLEAKDLEAGEFVRALGGLEREVATMRMRVDGSRSASGSPSRFIRTGDAPTLPAPPGGPGGMYDGYLSGGDRSQAGTAAAQLPVSPFSTRQGGANNSVISAIHGLGSPERRLESEFQDLADQLRQKQAQVAELETRLAAAEDAATESRSREPHVSVKELQAQVRELLASELVLKVEVAKQKEVAADRMELVDLLRKEFQSVSLTMSRQSQELATAKSDRDAALIALNSRQAELDATTLEIDRERRASKAVREMLELREREIETLNSGYQSSGIANRPEVVASDLNNSRYGNGAGTHYQNSYDRSGERDRSFVTRRMTVEDENQLLREELSAARRQYGLRH